MSLHRFALDIETKQKDKHLLKLLINDNQKVLNGPLTEIEYPRFGDVQAKKLQST